MSSLRAEMRAGVVSLLEAYRTSASLKLQIYPGRPRSLLPPTAFVDRITESRVFTGPTLVQRTPRVDVVVIHGQFDSKDAADQGDAFVDGFLAYADTQYHAASNNSVLGVVETADEPNYVPDWLPENEQRSYYATVLTLEGFGN